MRLNDEYDEFNKGRNATIAGIIASVIILLVIVTVLSLNKDKISKSVSSTQTASEIASLAEMITEDPIVHDEESSVSVGTLKPSDLDFFEMYPEEEEETKIEEKKDSEDTKKEESDYSTDGLHTLITYYDGSTEWVSISRYITKNSYDYTNLEDRNSIKKYIVNSRTVSSFGVEISKDQDYVDFVKLRNAGCEFVILRVGARGYESGQLSVDDYFEDNLRRAVNAGLDVGVYFISQAITEEEAKEEAALVIEKIGDYELKYPVSITLQKTVNPDARNEVLTNAERTDIIRYFLEDIKEAGFKTAIYGSKAFLITKIDLIKVAGDYDVFLTETADLPSYPYEFNLWEYKPDGKIDGVKGEVSFIISFVDYDLI